MTTKTPTTHAYIRVSTDRQDEASQRQQLDAWLSAHPQPSVRYWSDAASGSTPWRDRAIAQIIAAASPGDALIVTEISRIARSTIGVLDALAACRAAGITVIVTQSGMTLDDSLPSTIVTTVLALAAQIERDLLRERTRAALAARRARGERLGRHPGPSTASVLDARGDQIAPLLAARVPLRAIARVLNVAPGTLYRYIRLRRAQPPSDQHRRSAATAASASQAP